MNWSIKSEVCNDDMEFCLFSCARGNGGFENSGGTLVAMEVQTMARL